MLFTDSFDKISQIVAHIRVSYIIKKMEQSTSACELQGMWTD